MDVDPDLLLRSEDIRRELNIDSDEEDDQCSIEDLCEGEVLGSEEEDIADDDENELSGAGNVDFDLMNSQVSDDNLYESIDNSSQLSDDGSQVSVNIPVNNHVNNPNLVNVQTANGTVNNNVCPVCNWQHDDNFVPFTPNFDSSKSGILISDNLSGNNWEEVEAFYEMFDFDFVSHIAQETNKYYRECSAGPQKEFSKLNRWTDTNADELYCFFAVTLLMPHIRKNTVKQYWTTDPLLETPIFSKIFSQDRYLILRRMLHFDDNVRQNGGDKLYKMRTIIETLRKKFSSIIEPYQNLVIDESLMLWKGRLSFRQYIPNKRNRFGIKLFVICDCLTGIVLDFIVYTGKGTDLDDDNSTNDGLTAKVIKTLMKPYLNKGHVIYMDNWYSSPQLFSWLHDKQTGACGTLNMGRKNLPCLPKKMKKDDVAVRHNDKSIVIRWCDRRAVTMISTVDKHEMVSVDTRYSKNLIKPKCVVNYNANMGAVDKSDMLVSYNDSTRKTLKWYTKLFFHLLDLSMVNAFYMYKQNNPRLKVHIMEFRLKVVRQLLERHFTPRNETGGGAVSRPVGGESNPLRLRGRHFMRPLPTNADRKRKLQRKCYVCLHTTRAPPKRKDTSYECSTCEVALCIYPCFEQFHTMKKL